jgi:arginine/ornithine transport system permease protein
MDWAVIRESLPLYVDGLRVTLMLLAVSITAGFALSVPLAMARVSPRPWLSKPVWLYTYVIRGTPLLVQLYMIYLKSAWFCAWFAFAINTTAYTTEIFAGALRATPAGEIEAARSLGMSPLAIYRRILWPGALRRALPQYGNEVVMMMHATAIASAVSIVELTRVARDVYSNHLLPAEAFGTVAVFYFVLTFAFVGGFKLLERRYLRHLRPKSADVAGSGPLAASARPA